MADASKKNLKLLKKIKFLRFFVFPAESARPLTSKIDTTKSELKISTVNQKLCLSSNIVQDSEMIHVTTVLFFFWGVLECQSKLVCDIKYGQNRLTYNVSDAAAAGIIISPGHSVDYMQVFHCTCPTNNVSEQPTYRFPS